MGSVRSLHSDYEKRGVLLNFRAETKMKGKTNVSGNGIVVDMLDQYRSDPSDINLYQVIDSILIRANQGALFYADESGKNIFTGRKELPSDAAPWQFPVLLSQILESAFQDIGAESVVVNPGIHDFLLSEDLLTMIMAGRFTDAERNHVFLRKGVPSETRCDGAASWDQDVFREIRSREEGELRLKKSFLNVLEAARKKGLHSLALISVPEPSQLLPAETSARILTETAAEWMNLNRNYGMSVEFCCDETEYGSFLKRIFDQSEDDEIFDQLSAEAVPEEKALGDAVTGQKAPEEAVPEEEALDDAVSDEKAPEEAVPDQKALGDAVSDQRAPEEAVPDQKALGDAVSDRKAPEEAVPDQKTLGDAVSGRRAPEEAVPEQPKSPAKVSTEENPAPEKTEISGNEVIRYGEGIEETAWLLRSAQSSFSYFGEKYESVDDYVEKMRQAVFSGKKTNEFLWGRIRPQVIMRATLEKFRQNPDLLKMLLDTGIAIPERTDAPREEADEEAQILMNVRRELRIWSFSGKDISFREYSLEDNRQVWDMKLSELVRLPGVRELVLPFAYLMAFYQKGKLKNEEDFIAKAPDIRCLNKAMTKRKGRVLPEWRELLQRLSDAEYFGSI